MGQYYRLFNIDKRKEFKHDWDLIGGLKLVEHSYLANAMSVYLREKLANDWKGDRILHIGDYAKSDDGTRTAPLFKKYEEDGTAVLKEDEYGNKIYTFADSVEVIPKGYADCDLRNYRYVANIDKKEYFDLEEVIPDYICIDQENGSYILYARSRDPLLLLTACGNGQGGGDYNESSINGNLIGFWAGDHLMTTNDLTELDGFSKKTYYFIEGQKPNDFNENEYLKNLINSYDVWIVDEKDYRRSNDINIPKGSKIKIHSFPSAYMKTLKETLTDYEIQEN